jgi:cobalt-zinc-cadmium efflux system outer membrane protein
MYCFSFARIKIVLVFMLMLSGLFSLSIRAASVTSTTLTLPAAINAALQHNPQLAAYQFRVKAIAGEQQTAALRPEWRLSADAENVAGSGEFKGTDAGEFTLGLSSMIELGDQRAARLELVAARQQQLSTEQKVLLLDVTAEVTRRFVAVVAAQQQLLLQQDAQRLAEATATAMQRQVQAGRTAEAEGLRAKAALERSVLEVRKAEQQWRQARMNLVLMWAESEPAFTQVQADLFALQPPLPLADVLAGFDTHPDMLLLNEEVRLRSAELHQSKTEGSLDLEWNLGLRRFQESGDDALVMGLSVPLGANRRAAGAIASATANQQLAEQQRAATRVQLQAQLANVYALYQEALAEVNSLRQQVVPLLDQAMQSTTYAFNQGRYSYLELSAARREWIEAQGALIDAAVRAHETRIELERITGSAVTAPDAGEAK